MSRLAQSVLAHTSIRLLLGCVFAATFSLAGSPAARAQTYTVDSVHSSVAFRVLHNKVSDFWGRFNNIKGTLKLDDASPSVEITVRADSVYTGNSGRDDHLKGADFFNARQFPDITFKSTSVKKDGDKYEAEGTLTLHGVSKPMKAQIVRTGESKDQRGGTVSGFSTEFEIKRSDFGMTGGGGGIGDDVKLFVGLECSKK